MFEGGGGGGLLLKANRRVLEYCNDLPLSFQSRVIIERSALIGASLLACLHCKINSNNDVLSVFHAKAQNTIATRW